MDGRMIGCLDTEVKEPRGQAVAVRFGEAAQSGQRDGRGDPKAGEWTAQSKGACTSEWLVAPVFTWEAPLEEGHVMGSDGFREHEVKEELGDRAGEQQGS